MPWPVLGRKRPRDVTIFRGTTLGVVGDVNKSIRRTLPLDRPAIVEADSYPDPEAEGFEFVIPPHGSTRLLTFEPVKGRGPAHPEGGILLTMGDTTYRVRLTEA